MRKISILVAIIFASGMALGHGGDHGSLPDPGHMPGSMMYGLEQAYESVSLAVTFDKEKKANKKMKFAQKRLSESAHLAEENETERAAAASERYLENMREAEQMANETGNEELTQSIQEKQDENSEILQDLQERLPDEASQGIQKAIENTEITGNPSTDKGRQTSGFVATGRAIN